MKWQELDLAESARLPGRQEQKGWLRWGTVSAALFLGGLLFLAPGNLRAAGEITEPPPYTGVIQNRTRVAISVPSVNSSATLIIPPGGWIEYKVWHTKFDLTVYVNGKPYSCQRVYVAPLSYRQLCTDYDFLAEIRPVKPKPAVKCPVKGQRRPARIGEAVG
jgi:hypothetical protein